MSYMLPSKYACEKGHEAMWSPDNDYIGWPSSVARNYDRRPVCPKCWNEFLEANKLLMTRVPKPDPEQPK